MGKTSCVSQPNRLRPERSAGLHDAALSEKASLSNGDDLRVGATGIEFFSTKSGRQNPVTGPWAQSSQPQPLIDFFPPLTIPSQPFRNGTMHIVRAK